MSDLAKLKALFDAVDKHDQVYFDDEAPEEAKDESMLELRAAAAALKDDASSTAPSAAHP